MGDRRARRIDSRAAAVSMLAPYFRSARRERLIVAHLGRDDRLLGVTLGYGAGMRTVELPARRIVRDALAVNSGAIVLAHNHPSGDPSPSPTDVALTRALAGLLKPLDVSIRDHLIFGADGHSSFRALGLL